MRTFDGRKISDEYLNKLLEYTKLIKNPYDIPVEFLILNSKKYSLSSPVIKCENCYIAAKVPRVKYCEEAFGYSFEKMVLYAWKLGIGTTWIGGTLNRPVFEKAANTSDGEYMMIVSPLGYPSDTRSEVDKKLRDSVKGDERFESSQIFFENDFKTPLKSTQDCLEAVRWAPSAANRQPWRIVKIGDNYHFYVAHTPGDNSCVGWDVQKIDVGIAICHFMSVKKGKFTTDDPEIESDEYIEYIATINVGE